MKNEQSKLGEQFQKAFQDFKPEPSTDLWEKISQRAELQQIVKPAVKTSLWKIFVGGASFIAVIVAVVFYTTSTQKPSVIAESKPPATNTKTVQANNTLTTEAQPMQQTKAENQDKKQNTVMQQKIVVKQDQNNTATNGLEPLSATARINIPHLNSSAPVISEKKQNNPIQQLPVAHSSSTPATSEKYTSSGSQESNNSKPGLKDSIEVIPSQKWCKGDALTLWAHGGTSYTWNTGETTETILVNPSSSTTYSVSVTDHTGLVNQYNITISVVECNWVTCPSSFSPNYDGVNDEYKVFGTDITNFTLRIFTRTSQIVFETKDINEGWDGKIKGVRAEMGVYIYQVTYTDPNGKDHKQTGSITLM